MLACFFVVVVALHSSPCCSRRGTVDYTKAAVGTWSFSKPLTFCTFLIARHTHSVKKVKLHVGWLVGGRNHETFFFYGQILKLHLLRSTQQAVHLKLN